MNISSKLKDNSEEERFVYLAISEQILLYTYSQILHKFNQQRAFSTIPATFLKYSSL